MTEKACACGVAGCDCGPDQARPEPVGDPILFLHAAIRDRMLAGIGRARVGGQAPLQALTTRDSTDPAIALVDAFALGLHNLAWNANRLWRDGTITNGTDRTALVALAGELGYVPRPAISATTILAFGVDETEGAPERVAIPQGLKIASVPQQDELPKTFETDATVEARRTLNKLYPHRPPLHQPVGASTSTLVLRGTAPGAREGDTILAFAGKSGGNFKWLAARIVDVERPVPGPVTDGEPGETEPATTVLTLAGGRLVDCTAAYQFQVFRNRVFLMGERARPFGATAPDIVLMSDFVREKKGNTQTASATQWKDFVLAPGGDSTGGSVDLDAVHEAAAVGRAVLFATVDKSLPERMAKIHAVSEGARADFALSATVTRIGVQDVDLSDTKAGYGNKVRETAILIETAAEKLYVAEKDEPVPNAGAGLDRIKVKGVLEDLEPGRLFVIEGEKWSSGKPGSGERAVEAATLASVVNHPDSTTLVFTESLANVYRSDGLVIRGNCLPASEGETPLPDTEQIGVTDAADPMPKRALRTGPLAHVPAPGARGYAPALEVRVGGRLYAEAERIWGKTGADRVYRVLPPNPGGTGTSEIQFAGRLPGGAQPITARYRKGGGASGNLVEKRITTILSPVLGLRDATNPIPADGGSDAEGIEDIRTAAPASVRVLDRVVSRADYEAFAAAYRGVGKAMAVVLRTGMREIMCLTIATTAMNPPTAGSDLPGDLEDALKAAGPPGRALLIAGFDKLTADVTVAFTHDPALHRETVERDVRAALLAAFAPEVRPFGRALHRSEVIDAVQRTAGVVAARITAFALPGGPPEDHGRLLCPMPAFDGGTFRQGGLLSLAHDSISFEEMTP